MSKIIAESSTRPSPKKVVITSNTTGNKVDITSGFSFLEYHENIFSDTNKMSYGFVDTGSNILDGTVKEKLPLYNSEDIEFVFADGNDVKLKLKFVVDENFVADHNTTNSSVLLKCISEESLQNECEESKVKDSYQGTIADHVKSLLTNNLKTKKNIKVDNGTNYNYVGNNHKPIYVINWLSKHDTADKKGKTAGFLFFETSEGFQYRSIDKLLSQKPKRSFIMTDSVEYNDRSYGGKIMEANFANQTNALTKLRSGIKSELITFDPRDRKFNKKSKTEKSDANSGKDFAKFNKKFAGCVTRTTFMMSDTGSQPGGKNKQQIRKNSKKNFEADVILNQAITRYNEIDAQQSSIVIPADFTLHAGDNIFIDINSLSNLDLVDGYTGGKYMIVSLTHRMESNGVFTKLNISRDKFLRQGKPSAN